MTKTKLTFFTPDLDNPIELPFITAGIKAGFPSPAADFDENKISLDNVLVKNRETTFYAKASGTSMIGAGIDDGDIMVIDRSLEPKNNKVAVCLLDGEFTVKRIKITKEEVFLMPENKLFEPIKITDENQLVIWGIVTYVIKKMY
ncbi:translesion error-prone DNA polymerase V autoproteolytic subunit [Flavobacterium azooxidireducens]|uniref:Translesion error-prone DNA polymerase V autoproteolytic subunit n=1 Tax=Flavobacterium azooxidireducens TaxID=1871076 RepID=A0ABY4KKH0_9FLAO|nr:translesion error-prone DNA polymerase V autoproteolytic subunit [Flavobacterium azooxidireducens]UPQ80801.1 translesion error-prone DNA polymerase V autoproteolytic subunit [Flavobacterium azooxidireducens]